MAKANTPAGKKTPPASKDNNAKAEDAPKAADAAAKEEASSASKAASASAKKKATPKADAKASAAGKTVAEAAPKKKPADAKPAAAREARASSSKPPSPPAKAEGVEAVTQKAETSKKADNGSKPEPKPEAKPVTPKPEAKKDEAPKKADEKEPPKAEPAAPASRPAAQSVAVQPQPAQGGGRFWPLVTGGVVAGLLGFAVSELDLLNSRASTDDIRATVASQSERLTALENAGAPEVDLSGLESSLAAMAETVGALEERLGALEARPAGGTGGSSAAYAEELAALQASVGAQKAEIDRLLANAQSIEEATAAAANAAAAQAALAKITAAIGSGAAYAPALQELSDSGTDVPAALASGAAEGLPTLLSLQTDFADTARAALSATRAAGSDGAGEGLGSFLRRQLGARSVAPREGSDPDAVLSRAEAAVRDGQLAAALAEIDTLPPEATAAMEGWIARARARTEAEAAVQAVSDSLRTN